MKHALLFMVLAASLVEPLAQAKSLLKIRGNDAGGGGNAVVCRNSQGQISSAETLDLFEARIMDGLKIKSSALDPMERSARDAERLMALNPANFKGLDGYVVYVAYAHRMLPPDIGLEPIEDAFPIINKKGCKIEQLARYLENDQLLIDSEIWNALDQNSQAALYFHEGLYRYLRDWGATTSKRTRKILGLMMGEGVSLDPVTPPGKVVYRCSDRWARGQIAFTAIADPTWNAYMLYFSILNGQPLVAENNMLLSDTLFADSPGAPPVGGSTISAFEGLASLTFQRIDDPQNAGKIVFEISYENAPGENHGAGKALKVVCEKSSD